MTAFFDLIEEAHVTQLATPATDAAGRTSAYVNMGLAQRVYLIAELAQGNAATVLLSVLQATSSAGAGVKALVNTAPIWANLDTTVDAFTRVSPDAVTYTTDAALKNKIVVFEVDADDLDIANGFKFVALSTGASNAANLTSILAIATNLRYSV